MQAIDRTHPNPAAPSDADLVDRVRRGETRAYGTLVERYERAVLAAVLAVLRNLHSAQDVVQDVLVAGFTRLHSLRDPSRFGPWLLKAAEREAVHASRRARRLRIAFTPDDVDVGAEPAEPLLSDERERLLRCVRSLPPHERLAVSLHYFEGRAVHDIALATGLAVGTVTKQLSRALSRLRDQLKRESPPWQPTTKKNASAKR
jgi:RNA polymerase sigma-70 factor (ECF subfamily)